jgi:hypothetical protein
MWKNVIKLERAQMTIGGMCVACWVPINTLSENETLVAFQLQQRLHERASILRQKCIVFVFFTVRKSDCGMIKNVRKVPRILV